MAMRADTTVTAAPAADLFRKLPAVDELARSPQLASLILREGETAVRDAVRCVLALLRLRIHSGQLDAAGIDSALAKASGAVEEQLRESVACSLRPVVNATGVILHTNLGRAPLPLAALEHIREVAGGYCNLEFDADTGSRGARDVHVDRLFARLLFPARAIQAEGAGRGALAASSLSTLVVNNNAAAVLLALNTLAENGEVIVSRGELVEIGGSFRIPEVMAKSNARLREVGTTNRTRIADYENAINQNTKLLLRVHRSNFEIKGFTEQPSIAELSELARRRALPLMEDLGSGALFDLRPAGVEGEPGVLTRIEEGLDVVSYSGDKLLGGPQAGLLSGRSDLIARMRANSLFRALRVDKLTYAALESTLLAYVRRDYQAIPLLRMMTLPAEEIGRRAEAIAAQIRSSHLIIEVVDGDSVVGGGAAPSAVLPTRLLALTSPALSAEQMCAALRQAEPPIIARVEQDRVLLDLRTVFPEQEQSLGRALSAL